MSRALSYVVPPSWEGRTVQDFCRRYLGLSSRAFVKQKHLPGGLLRNGTPCRSVDVLAQGDVLVLQLPQDAAVYEPQEGPLSVVWEDEDYLVVDKPPHMPIHPSPGHSRDSLLNRVAFYYEKAGQTPLFRPLYRLDRDTSGLVVLGKNRVAVSSAQVGKRYYALCQGTLAGAGTIRAPIGLEPGSKIRRHCSPDGQSAVTHWESLLQQEGYSLLKFHLETGRTHQIRVHMASLGYPLAGDDLYGGSLERIPRQALHCGAASLTCVPLRTDLKWICPFPEDFLRAFPWVADVSPAI